MKPRKWLLAADKRTLVNLDRVSFIYLDGKNEVKAIFANEKRFISELLFPAETGELGFDHLRKILIGE